MHSTKDSPLPQPPPPNRPGGTSVPPPPPAFDEDRLAVAAVVQDAHDATYNLAHPNSAYAIATRRRLGDLIEILTAEYNASEPWRSERAA